ncbi:hypothetical protein Pst134EA_030276 [Puccinia striiformis f. sp. tritici]|uniref:Uncharacterized protein n=1 Tax=Puccinia striiformis f. sp. tritici PST-78 TaxID=1165861 RepID=A0A0L0V825_9BASI|nr:hypothetical protein Pst134EA_030276 [Puccinia striiformis f. sp. tritici]KAH9440188.1 hypothetical protein Pst134EB_030816 [Puccinia striiformis f. sp. tritici]KAH9446355.1 hypothetical protein Pst134EA_030276 [Puccinia striiformis f. sp. tritici]KAI9607054.1 hypothetical protein KEM48_001609 [Puccinia striiformis f. sp. tritici PST-130]KNE95134.1 hypothetical protein PSTG_11501 [Puccinia striiformis f. sp. tritici PST-78]
MLLLRMLIIAFAMIIVPITSTPMKPSPGPGSEIEEDGHLLDRVGYMERQSVMRNRKAQKSKLSQGLGSLATISEEPSPDYPRPSYGQSLSSLDHNKLEIYDNSHRSLKLRKVEVELELSAFELFQHYVPPVFFNLATLTAIHQYWPELLGPCREDLSVFASTGFLLSLMPSLFYFAVNRFRYRY